MFVGTASLPSRATISRGFPLSLRLVYEGREIVIPDGNTAVIGSDPDATVRVTKPGISRRHVVVKHDGHAWVVQDASSRNGTYHHGARIQSLDVDEATTIFLGHPSDGAEVSLEPTTTPGEETQVAEPTRVVPRTPVAPVAAPPTMPQAAPPPAARDQELEQAVRALRDVVSSIRGLTWSVWAMIAVTAILALLTLFVGIIGQ
jgi:pSer/pThr/pTyr-binding forkhead associated (FHA) protein